MLLLEIPECSFSRSLAGEVDVDTPRLLSRFRDLSFGIVVPVFLSKGMWWLLGTQDSRN